MAKIKVKTLTDNKGENFYPLTHGTAVVNDQGINMEDRMTHVEDTVEQKSKEQAEFFETTDARVSETEGQVAQFESSVTQEVAGLKQAQNEFYATTNTRVQSFEDDVEARLAEKAKIGVVDETGDSNEYVMSQAAVTRELTELGNYVLGLPESTEEYYPWVVGFIKPSGELTDTNDAYLRTGYINIEGIRHIQVKRIYKNPYLSPIAFYDKDYVFLSAPLNDGTSAGDYDAMVNVPTEARYVAFTSHKQQLLNVNFFVNAQISILNNRSEICNLYNVVNDTNEKLINISKITNENNAVLNGGSAKADLSGVNISGFLNKVDGSINANAAWVHGYVPILQDATEIVFNNLPSAKYSSAVKNYFVDEKGKSLVDSVFSGEDVLGKGLVTMRVPFGAKSLLFHGSTDDISSYDISFNVVGITDKRNRKLIIPDKLYAIVGQEFNLYYDSLIKGMDAGLESPKNIYIDIQCPTLQNASNGIGVRKERMWQIIGSKLTEQYIGTHPLQVTAYSNEGNIIDRKEVNVVVSSASAISSQKAILCIGDSLTNNGPIVSTCAEHFSNIGGAQPVFIGQRTTSGYKHEGYPGYTFASFVNSGSANAFIIFDIPQETSVSVGDKYSTNSSTYTVVDIRTEGQDNLLRLRCTRSGSTTPSSTGALTKVSGASTSPSSIQYSAFEAETGNPFWDAETSSVNLTKYREKMGMNTVKFDAVVIMLGTNDCIADIQPSMQNSVNAAKVLINAILTDAGTYPTKIILQMTPPDANTTSSWQVYSDQPYSRKIGYWSNMWELRKLMYEEFTKDEWKDKVFLGQAALGVDRYYGYPFTEVESSQRISSIKEIYHTNSVHPNTDGYKQLGDGYYLQLKSLL